MQEKEDKLAARIQKMRDQVRALEDRKKARDAQKQARKENHNRKVDTRRKLLVGAAVLNQVERGFWSPDRLQELMSEFLTRPGDRILFNLPASQMQDGHDHGTHGDGNGTY